MSCISVRTRGGEPNWPITAYLSGLVLTADWLAARLAAARGWTRLAWQLSIAAACLLGLGLTAFLHRYFEIMKDETRHVIQVEERRVSEAMRDQFREDLWEFHPELLEAELLAVRQEPIAQPAAATL